MKTVKGQIIENTQDKSVQEMKSYVERLPKILEKKKKLTLHTAIAECIKEHTDRDDFIDTLKVLYLCENFFII